MTGEVQYFGESDVGLRRPNNEDAFVVRPEMGLCAVADGMGGAAAGEVASQVFVETAVDVFSENGSRLAETDPAQLVQMVFALANERVLQHVELNPQHKGMGCTAEVVAFGGDGFVLGHLGDSRTYRMRNGELKQLSSDHSFVQDQVDRGMITAEEAKRHPMRNIILRAIGAKEDVALDIIRGKTYRGDLFLLCSDGLTDMVDDSAIGRVLAGSGSLAEKGRTLIDLAKAAGGKDNITIVMAQVG